MSNIEKIKDEIERRKKRWMYDDLPIAMGRYYEDRDLLTFIDSLPEDNHFRDSTKMVSEDLEEAADSQIRKMVDAAGHPGWDWTTRDIKDAFIAGANWQKAKDDEETANTMTIVALDAGQRAREELLKEMPMPEDTVIFMKGVAEGRRLEREDRNDDKLPRYYGD